jgi:outer membrane protease
LNNIGVAVKNCSILFAAFLLIPLAARAQVDPSLQQIIMDQTLDAVEMHGVAVKTTAPPPPPSELKPYRLSERTTRKTAPFPREEETALTKTQQSDLSVVKHYIFGENGNPDSNIALGVQTGYITGTSTYHISFDNPIEIGGHTESELEWPLNNALIGIGLELNYKGSVSHPTIPNRAGFRFSWFTRIDQDSGTMKDSDWIENDIGYIDYNDNGALDGSSAWASNHDGLDIFSQSPSKLEACNIIDLNYNYNFLVNDFGALGLLLGYYYQYFRFSVHSLNQVGYGPYGPGPYDQTYQDPDNLKWGEYIIETQVPYFGASGELNWRDKLSLFLSFGYSAWAMLKDEDTHLYPTVTSPDVDMVSNGKTNSADAYLVNVTGNWRLAPRWLLSLGGSFVSVSARKSVVEHFYVDGVEVSSTPPIDETAKSEYWLARLSLKYVF